MVTAAPDHIPPALVAQLAEGGRLVLPVGRGEQELLRLTRKGGEAQIDTLLPVRFVPMTGKAQE
jgi:protein-L-isoaspartate(D-aspartate) O-methyltransferase